MLRFAWARARALTTSTLVAAIALSSAVLAQDKDTLNLKDGKLETGRVNAEEFAGLDFKPDKGEARKFTWDQIAPNGIAYGDAEELRLAREALDGKKYEDALTELAKAKENAKLRPVVRQNVLYWEAWTLEAQGKPDEAFAAYQELIKAFPKSRYLMEVGQSYVAIHSAKKDYAGATKALDALASEALNAGVDQSFNQAVNVLKGRVFEAQSDFQKANGAYALAANATGVPQHIVLEGILGQARCELGLKKPEKAEQLFRSLTTKDASNVVLAGAWNGIGDILLNQVRDPKNAAQSSELVLDALYAFLRGVVQYSPLAGQSTEEYERALAGSAQCFDFMAQVEKDNALKAVHRQRAQARRDQLKKEFPNSRFLNPN